jgi:hypothetical protein
MNGRDVPTSDMRRLLARMADRDHALDPNTANRLLDGELAIDDVPPSARSVARVVESVRANATEAELAGQPAAVATLTALIRRASLDDANPQRTPMSKQRIFQFAAAGTIGAMTLFSGLAAANALPGAAQSVASEVLGKVGVSVPNPDDHAGTHPGNRGESSSNVPDNTSTTSAAESSTTTSTNGKGSEISGLAHSTTATGEDKGAVISGAASDGKSHAGEPHGTDASETPDTTPAVTTTSNGTDNGNTQGAGKDANGQTNSDGAKTNGAGSDGSSGTGH